MPLAQECAQVRHRARHGPGTRTLARRRDPRDDPEGRRHVQGEGKLERPPMGASCILLRFMKKPSVYPMSTSGNNTNDIKQVFALKSYIWAMRVVYIMTG